MPSILSQLFPPKPKFTVDDIPDLRGKVIIVTGANTGIGKEIAKALLAHNAKVYIAARSPEKSEKAIQELRDATGKEAHFLLLDLGDLKSIKAAAEEFLSKETELHVLFNNAGVMCPPSDHLTTDGYDLQFGTNVLGHFYLTTLLLPLLISTAKTSPDGKARVVTSSSLAHLTSIALNFDVFKDGPTRQKMSTRALYYHSKLGNIVFAMELARRYGSEGIISTSIHPGIINTDLFRHTDGLKRLLMSYLLHDVSFGALTQLWAGTSAEGATLNGKYLIPWARIGAAREDSQSPEIGKQLWTWMEEQVEHV